MKSSQTQRIVSHFLANPNVEISAPMLNRIGSGNAFGYCNSFSKKISDARKNLALKGDLLLTKDIIQDGQRQTGYTYFPKPIGEFTH